LEILDGLMTHHITNQDDWQNHEWYAGTCEQAPKWGIGEHTNANQVYIDVFGFDGVAYGNEVWWISTPEMCLYLEESCDCDGSIPDCNGVCGGDSQLDECGVCGGNGYADWECNDGSSTCWNIAEGDCDCADNIEDCAGVCGGSAVVDECGVCAGDGIDEAACDCDGNVEDCVGECGGNAELDDCGNCEGTCSADEDGFVTCEQVEEYIADCAGVCEGIDGSLVNICIGVEDETSQSECEDAGGYWSEDGIDECNECGGDGTSCLSLYYALIPDEFSIHSIYPNPFNPVTNIIYGLPEYVNVQIIVYDISGKQIETLINQFQTPGYHSVIWNADNHPSGLYFVNMTSGSYVKIQKLMLVK